MAGTNFNTPITVTTRISLTDVDGYGLFGTSAGSPSTTTNVFQKGCIIEDTTNGTVYYNSGTLASPTWTALSGGGGGSFTSTNGVATYNGGTGDQVIAHGLGATPKVLRIIAGRTSAGTGISNGTYNGTTNATHLISFSSGASSVSTVFLISTNGSGAVDYYEATATMDATNITISWVQFGTGEELCFTWEVEG